MSDTPKWFDVMLDPNTYPHKVDKVELIQTHISWVFLAGPKVYKIKKPVNFGFLDFTTLDKRLHFCKEELRLNKRLCPDIYLDVIPLSESQDKIVLGDDSNVIEWVLVMNKMPHENLMNKLIERELFDKSLLEKITQKLVPFYKNAIAPEEKAKELGSLETIKFNTEENFEQTASFINKLIDQATYDDISKYTREFEEKNQKLFEDRIINKKIVDGHGDLHSGNICFDFEKDDVYIFDCIEFNERFRFGDIAVDLAFLAMDLDNYGHCILAKELIDELSQSLDDPGLKQLIDFYKCYRAYVRFKIGCFTWASDGIDEQTKNEAQRQAKRYAKLAHRYAGFKKPATLWVFLGLTGTGKSTIARKFSQDQKINYYNSDVIRKEIANIPVNQKVYVPYNQGLYSKEMTQRTYNALIRRAAKDLIIGEDAIIDATFTDASYREKVIELCQVLDVKPVFIHCTLDEKEVKKRLYNRQEAENDVSDGRWEIYLAQKKAFKALDDIKEKATVIELDTSNDIDTLLESLKAFKQ